LHKGVCVSLWPEPRRRRRTKHPARLTIPHGFAVEYLPSY
jgi:hypothetical protein